MNCRKLFVLLLVTLLSAGVAAQGTPGGTANKAQPAASPTKTKGKKTPTPTPPVTPSSVITPSPETGKTQDPVAELKARVDALIYWLKTVVFVSAVLILGLIGLLIALVRKNAPTTADLVNAARDAIQNALVNRPTTDELVQKVNAARDAIQNALNDRPTRQELATVTQNLAEARTALQLTLTQLAINLTEARVALANAVTEARAAIHQAIDALPHK